MNDKKIMLEVRDMKRDYHIPGGFMKQSKTVHAVKGVSFKLETGKTLAIVGESGCGKSTLARMLTFIDEPTSGELVIDGEKMDTRPGHLTAEMRQKVQIVFQNPYGSLNPRQKIGPEHYNRYPHMFSGGQRQRIAIARALMLNPKLLVLDEPVSALDLSVQAQVLNLLADLQDEFGLTYVFISHDLSVVKYIADEVMVMYFGEAVEHGTRDEVFSDPKHSYTRTLFAATPKADVDSIRARVAAKAMAKAG